MHWRQGCQVLTKCAIDDIVGKAKKGTHTHTHTHKRSIDLIEITTPECKSGEPGCNTEDDDGDLPILLCAYGHLAASGYCEGARGARWHVCMRRGEGRERDSTVSNTVGVGVGVRGARAS